MNHYTLKFVEKQFKEDQNTGRLVFCGSNTFLVSTRKIEAFAKEKSFKYVSHLVNLALDQHTLGFSPSMCIHRKSSFTAGGTGKYDALMPEGEGYNDPIIEVDVELI